MRRWFSIGCMGFCGIGAAVESDAENTGESVFPVEELNEGV